MSNGVCYRRGSLFWALILIAIGGLFLYRNFNPEIHAWELIGKYWPVLIIFWGLGKLVDYFALRGQPGQTVFLTGGEVFLLIFILLVGTAISKATQRGTWPMIQINDEDWPFHIGDRFEYTDQQTQAAKPRSQITITNEEGAVSVVGMTKDQIEVVAHKTVYAKDEAQGKQVADQSTVKIKEVTGGGYEIEAVRGRSGNARTTKIDLDVKVPSQASVRISTNRGDVHVNSVTGEVDVSAEKSDVELESLTGNATVTLRRGSVRASNIKGNCHLAGRGDEVEFSNIAGEAKLEGEFYGPIKVSNVAKLTRFVSSRTDLTAEQLTGQLELESGSLYISGVKGPTTIITKNKDITLEDFSNHVHIENNRGNIELHPKVLGADIEVDNRSGGITLSVPPGSSFEINAIARSGRIESDINAPSLRMSDDPQGGSLQGSVGKHGPQVRLSTTYGTIELREGAPSPPPKPPAPPSRTSLPQQRPGRVTSLSL